jgi:hypothetical protein
LAFGQADLAAELDLAVNQHGPGRDNGRRIGAASTGNHGHDTVETLT